MLLLDGILRHDKLFVAEAHLVFGEGHVIVVLRVSIHSLFIGANLPIILSGLLEAWLGGIVFVFGTIRSAIVSCAGIAIFSMAGLRAAFAVERWDDQVLFFQSDSFHMN